jgi:hypothetical protein
LRPYICDPAREASVQLGFLGVRRARRRRGDGPGDLAIARHRDSRLRAPSHERDADSRTGGGQVARRAGAAKAAQVGAQFVGGALAEDPFASAGR